MTPTTLHRIVHRNPIALLLCALLASPLALALALAPATAGAATAPAAPATESKSGKTDPAPPPSGVGQGVAAGATGNSGAATDSATAPSSTVAEPANPGIENAVVKVFSTLRYPDPFRPWSKQAPSEVTASGVVIEGKRILTKDRKSVV